MFDGRAFEKKKVIPNKWYNPPRILRSLNKTKGQKLCFSADNTNKQKSYSSGVGMSD